MGDKLGLVDLPSQEVAHRNFLSASGSSQAGALKVAIAIDAILHAYDARRHGSRLHPVSLFDARLKEARRRHAKIRAIPIGMMSAARMSIAVRRPLLRETARACQKPCPRQQPFTDRIYPPFPHPSPPTKNKSMSVWVVCVWVCV